MPLCTRRQARVIQNKRCCSGHQVAAADSSGAASPPGQHAGKAQHEAEHAADEQDDDGDELLAPTWEAPLRRIVEPDNVKVYRFVKDYPAKTGVKSSQSGKPSQ